jgi:hypothetical protein
MILTCSRQPIGSTRAVINRPASGESFILTWEPSVVEYVIPGDWLGGADAARLLGNPAIDLTRRVGAKLVEYIGA